MPTMELMATVNSSDSETQVRGRVVRFLTSRGYRTTADPVEFKRGSLFGSLTGFTPKKWAVTVRFKTVEPGVFFYRFGSTPPGNQSRRASATFGTKKRRRSNTRSRDAYPTPWMPRTARSPRKACRSSKLSLSTPSEVRLSSEPQRSPFTSSASRSSPASPESEPESEPPSVFRERSRPPRPSARSRREA